MKRKKIELSLIFLLLSISSFSQISVQKTKEIMGDNFLSSQEVEKYYGIKFSEEDEKINFSPKMLDSVAELNKKDGQFYLIFISGDIEELLKRSNYRFFSIIKDPTEIRSKKAHYVLLNLKTVIGSSWDDQQKELKGKKRCGAKEFAEAVILLKEIQDKNFNKTTWNFCGEKVLNEDFFYLILIDFDRKELNLIQYLNESKLSKRFCTIEKVK